MTWVEGTVLSGGRPVPDTLLLFVGPQTKRATTNLDGWFRVRIKPGVYRVQVSKDGLQPIRRTIEVVGSTMGVEFDLTSLLTPVPVPLPVDPSIEPTRLVLDPPNAVDRMATYDLTASADGHAPRTLRVPDLRDGEIRDVVMDLNPA